MAIFLKSHIGAQNGMFKKQDLIEIFDEPFRIAKYHELESHSLAMR